MKGEPNKKLPEEVWYKVQELTWEVWSCLKDGEGEWERERARAVEALLDYLDASLETYGRHAFLLATKGDFLDDLKESVACLLEALEFAIAAADHPDVFVIYDSLLGRYFDAADEASFRQVWRDCVAYAERTGQTEEPEYVEIQNTPKFWLVVGDEE